MPDEQSLSREDWTIIVAYARGRISTERAARAIGITIDDFHEVLEAVGREGQSLAMARTTGTTDARG